MVRIPEIDGLRGVAALAVFGYHISADAGFPARSLPPFAVAGHQFEHVLSPLCFGASGVNLFFVISGFCLALQQLRAGGGALHGPALRRYFQGRFARIVPAYWGAVVISAVLVFCLGTTAGRTLLEDVGLHLFFLHGAARTRYLSLNGALWSMVPEVQFYIVFPWCFRLLTRLGAVRFVAITGLFDLLYRVSVAYYPFVDGPGSGVSTTALFASQLPGRGWEFALGMALAVLYLRDTARTRRLFAWLWLPSLVVAVVCRAFGPRYLPDLALGLFYASLCGLILITRRRAESGFVVRFVTSAGARFGRASYSFFLLHVPLLAVVEKFLPWDLGHPYRCFLLLFGAGLPICLGATVALYFGVESPLWRRLRP